MKKIMFSTVIIVSIFMMSCVSVSYLTDYPEDTSFTDYQTYAVEEHCLDFEIGVNPINNQRIENAIFLHLRNQGMKSSDQAELLVKYFVKNEIQHVVEGCEDYYDEWDGGRYCVERLHTYQVGTLVIDIIDQNQQKVVWHGAATGPVYDKLKNPNNKIRKIVNELLTDFDKKRKA